ncbi:MAG: 50S ribosomal protein L21 [Patescibacteria group bacterium]
MIAVVEIGSKQFTVKAGDFIEVDQQDAEVGAQIALNTLLVASEDGKTVNVGTPSIAESVQAKVVEHFRDDKITVFKMKSKKRYARTRGFRASRTKLEITKIA